MSRSETVGLISRETSIRKKKTHPPLLVQLQLVTFLVESVD